MADRPTFDEFHLALLYPAERARLGIRLDDEQARDLLADQMRALSYYSVWEPDHRKPRRRRIRGPRTGRRTIVGWVMFVALIAGSTWVAYHYGHGFVASILDTAGDAVAEIVGWFIAEARRMPRNFGL